jgi:hypothetical protein
MAVCFLTSAVTLTEKWHRNSKEPIAVLGFTIKYVVRIHCQFQRIARTDPPSKESVRCMYDNLVNVCLYRGPSDSLANKQQKNQLRFFNEEKSTTFWKFSPRKTLLQTVQAADVATISGQ